jgi:antitoxin (DNA-binding transcriptional repressor) of toxin-antitoxin stability system
MGGVTSQKSLSWESELLTATPNWCLFNAMRDVTSKMLHEKTGQLLDRTRQGERFRIVRGGRAEAFLVPATENIDPEWSEIMKDVWKARKTARSKRPNPVLRERRARNYAARLR